MRTAIQRATANLLIVITLLTSLGGFSGEALASLRAPAWYDQNAVNAAPDWHYRVPILVPAGATLNSTIKVDVNFATLLTNLSIAGTFDINSPRVVRSTGVLATNQEFTDGIFAGATDAIGDGKGEVRFILQDLGPVTYYLYFDITANGSKPANPQVPINGNFEVGSIAGASPQIPPGWATATSSNNTMDAQLRSNELVSVTENGQTINTNGNANTGSASYLQGFRSATDVGGNTVLTKTITIPVTNPGSISVRIKPEGFDSGVNGSITNYDFIRIRLLNGVTSVVNIVDPSLNNYATCPFSPNYNASAVTTTVPGYGNYNGWDNGSGSDNHTLGMAATFNRLQEPWVTCTASLAAAAGQTLTLEIRTQNTNLFRSWFLIDDVEWSVITATLGSAEAFGVKITTPVAATTFTAGQTLSIIAQVDAQPTAASNPVTADVFDNAGTLVANGIILYNDGTHGDATANDAIWSNTTALVIPVGYQSGANWLVRVYAKDASSSTIAVANGLIHIPGKPNTPTSQANFYNIDEVNISVNLPALSVQKTITLICDPSNGTTNPKNIPGSISRYTITVTNSGSASASLATVTDALSSFLTFDPNLAVGGSAATCTSTVPPGVAQSAIGNGFKINVTGSTRTGLPKFLTNAADGDGATFANPNITIDYTTAMPAGIFGVNVYTAGELKAGESVTVYFNVVVN